MTPDSSPAPSPLRRCWLALTGGAQGCPRRRFFLTFVPLSLLFGVLCNLYGPSSIMMSIYGELSDLLFLPVGSTGLLLQSLDGSVISDAASYLSSQWLYPLVFPERPAPGTWQMLPCFYLAAPLLFVLGLILFGLACRRLKDAGYSCWHLLFSLFSLVFFALCYVFPLRMNEASAFFFGHLGGFWLLWLYCKPTRPDKSDTP